MENDWIEWNGGDCPVSEHTPVEIQQRDTWLKDGKPRHFHVKTIVPTMLRWEHEDSLSDIIAYRVIPHPFAN